ncbi:MAG: glucose-1-phosphate adenylyltransferase [Pseudomonadota bacterium]|nr:glucose-1-phosphate adenylyltransferase [Pseudomonadota bacterium]
MKLQRSPRYVSRLTRDTLALILAGGRGSRLGRLTDWRAKPAVPFGGKFRIIDFPLSNCINSGIRRIGVLTQYKAHSLILHIHRGWSFLRGEFGEFVELLPAQQRIDTSWYTGTADAVYQNLDIIRSHRPVYLLILAGDHVYKMDYGPMIAAHVESGANLTVGCIEVPVDMASAFGVMRIDAEGKVLEFLEKPEDPASSSGPEGTVLASMGIYVANIDFLTEQLTRDANDERSTHDFGKDLIPALLQDYRVFVYPFRDAVSGRQAYWRDVGTIDAFWMANLELIGVLPELNLYDDTWPIWTYQQQAPPAKFVFDSDERRGMAVDSMVSGGCIISGAVVRHSLLFSNVHVNSYSSIEDSVILPGAFVGEHCHIHRAVIDENCHIPAGMIIGEHREQDAQRFYVTPQGVTLVVPEMLGQNSPYG